MTIRSLLIVSGMALSIAGIAGAKSWDITLDQPATIGATQLKAGDYHVKLDGAQAILTDEFHGTAVTIPVNIEHNNKKFDDTGVESVTQDGKQTIQAIELGGSDTRLVPTR